MRRYRCECDDVNCPCKGTCLEWADTRLHRVDLDEPDLRGVRLCHGCADHAYEPGVFETFGED